MRRAARVDSNHSEIVEVFRQLGCSVLSLAALGKGVPDLLVAVHGITWLVEIKAGKAKENALQTAWGASWQGSRALVRNTEDVELLVKRMLTSRF